MTGQGGFYGSGGARTMPHSAEDSGDDERHRMLAVAADVQKVQQVMSELEMLEHLLLNEDTLSSKSIEIKSSIKKLMTDRSLMECLNRLEYKGQPVWGLSTQEREMIIAAREKINDC